jgi:hypothetical protein
MTISFSYAYLNGLLRRTVSIVTSADLESLSPVVMAVHRSSRAMSPRNTARGTNNETEFIPTLWITEEIRPTIHENGLGDGKYVRDAYDMSSEVRQCSFKQIAN